MPIGKYTHFIIAWSLLACLLSKGLSDVSAKDSPLPTGSLVVSVLSEVGLPPEGLRIDYIQTSHDFLIGYDGPIPEVGLPDPPVGFNLILKCIPWSEIEPSRGSFPYEDEEISYYPVIPPGMITGNDCLLDFGNGGLTGWPDDLQDLAFEVLLERVPIYLEHAVRYQTSRGISLFVIKEPTYPNADLMSLTASQWVRLVKLACETIRMEAPWARIVIEIIPQYLPMLGYTPYTFLDNLIRGGVGFDGIMMVFSRPIATYISKSGYPHVNWVSGQVDIYSDLGKQMFIRFSGVPLVGLESERQEWLKEMVTVLFSKQTAVGLYWDEEQLFPPRLYGVSWPAKPIEPPASADIINPMLSFIHERTTRGEIETDANGQAIIHGYAGEYEIRVEGISGVIITHIYRGEERQLDINWPTSDPPIQESPENELMDLESKNNGHKNSGSGIVFMGVSAVLILCLGVAVWNKERKTNIKSRGTN